MKAKFLAIAVFAVGAMTLTPAHAGGPLVSPAIDLTETLGANGSVTPVYYRYGKYKRGGVRLHFGGFRGGYYRHRGYGKYRFSRKRFHRKRYHSYRSYRPYSYRHHFGRHGGFGRFGGS